MSFGPLTGGSINPARTLGPAIGAGKLTKLVPYMLAQFIGAVLVALLYRFVFAHLAGDEKNKAVKDEPAR